MEAITHPKGMFNETLHGLTTDELRLIIPIIKREHRHAEKMVNHYKDLTVPAVKVPRGVIGKIKPKNWRRLLTTLSWR